MFSRSRWFSIGVVCAGLWCAPMVQAREHGSLANVLQGYCDTRPHIAPGAEPPIALTSTTPDKVENGGTQADDFVVYTHMWQKNSAELGPLGRYQLELIARRLRGVSFPVVIETSHDEKLDMARRDMLISLLGARGFHDPSRVVVAYSEERVGAMKDTNIETTSCAAQANGACCNPVSGGVSFAQGSGYCGLGRGTHSFNTGR
jgi:hypothetical protein